MMKTELPNGSTRTAQRWLQDPSDRRVLLPNGVTLDPTLFPAAVNGKQIVRGGTAIGKTDAEDLFGPAAAGDDEVYLLWKTVDVADDPLAEAVRAGAVFEGLLPAPLDPAVRDILAGRGFQFIKYSGAGIDE